MLTWRREPSHPRREPKSESESGESGESGEAAEALGYRTPSDRELVTLIVWDGLGVGEAGAVLGLKLAAARRSYQRDRSALRDRLAGGETAQDRA